MSGDEVRIRLSSKYDPSGVKQAKKGMSDLGRAATILGQGFGGTFSMIGAVVKDLFTGGIWQVGARLVMYFWNEFLSPAERAKRALEDLKKQMESYHKEVEECTAAIKESHAAALSDVDLVLKKRNREIDSVKELTKAEIELVRQRRIAQGHDEKTVNEAADSMLSEVDNNAAQERIDEERNAAIRRQMIANGTISKAEKQIAELRDELRRQRRAMLNAEDEDAHKVMSAEVDKTEKQYDDVLAIYNKAKAEAKEAKKQIEQLDAKARTLLISAQAAEQKKENEREKSIKAEIEEQQREAARLAEAEQKEAARLAEMKQREAARLVQIEKAERERMERDLAQKRLANLQQELMMRRSDFDRAFAMYRDPEQARAAIGEEQDYRDDLERLHRDARRYGGKWRIDELSRLMASGDSIAVSDTLAQWRKSQSFTPEIEAMVRASAAEKSVNEADRAVIETAENTRNLAEKLDELLTMKGGE